MKREKLKLLIKEIVRTIYEAQTGANDEYEYEMEFDDLMIPGISEAGDYVLITATLNYNASPGCEPQLYGPPEKCSPGEDASIEIVNHHIDSVKVICNGQSSVFDESQIRPEQLQIINAAVEGHINDNLSDIQDKILSTVDFDYDPRADIERDIDENNDEVGKLHWKPTRPSSHNIRTELKSTEGHRLIEYSVQPGIWVLSMPDGSILGDSSEYANLTPDKAVVWANSHV